MTRYKRENQKTIFSNDYELFDALFNDFEKEGIFEESGLDSEHEKNSYVHETIDLYYDCELENLNQILDENIICIANLGLWNGRRTGYKVLKNNLNEVLKVGYHDSFSVRFDGVDVIAEDHHHDGTNYYTFRKVKSGVNIENLLEKLYMGKAKQSDITRYTESLKPFVCNIYGW